MPKAKLRQVIPVSSTKTNVQLQVQEICCRGISKCTHLLLFQKFRHGRFLRQHIPPWRRAPDPRWQSSGRYGRALGGITRTACPSHCIFQEVAIVIDCSRFVLQVYPMKREQQRWSMSNLSVAFFFFVCVKRSGTQHHAYVRDYRKFALLETVFEKSFVIAESGHISDLWWSRFYLMLNFDHLCLKTRRES